jgi:hypothetical protein
MVAGLIAQASTLDALTELWLDVKASGRGDEYRDAFAARGAELKASL